MNITIKAIDNTSIDTLLGLQDKVASELENRETYLLTDREEMESILGGEGCGVGAFVEEKLVGFFLAYFPKHNEDNLGYDLEVKEEELDYMVHLEAVVVDSEYRGNRLQTKMAKELMQLVESIYPVRRYLFTISPENPASLKSMEALGAKREKLKEKYGGILRYILSIEVQK